MRKETKRRRDKKSRGQEAGKDSRRGNDTFVYEAKLANKESVEVLIHALLTSPSWPAYDWNPDSFYLALSAKASTTLIQTLGLVL
jgi:hypothetical protein